MFRNGPNTKTKAYFLKKRHCSASLLKVDSMMLPMSLFEFTFTLSITTLDKFSLFSLKCLQVVLLINATVGFLSAFNSIQFSSVQFYRKLKIKLTKLIVVEFRAGSVSVNLMGKAMERMRKTKKTSYLSFLRFNFFIGIVYIIGINWYMRILLDDRVDICSSPGSNISVVALGHKYDDTLKLFDNDSDYVGGNSCV
uniref:Uncharacterized protein n=1 Tax=Glossina austeni TaxID=7395 RepID=A0A1A9UXP6_GLOAU